MNLVIVAMSARDTPTPEQWQQMNPSLQVIEAASIKGRTEIAVDVCMRDFCSSIGRLMQCGMRGYRYPAALYKEGQAVVVLAARCAPQNVPVLQAHFEHMLSDAWDAADLPFQE